jgi:Lrp/AsnC family transcriptional regulator for asnA, asnC and gidA
MAPVAYDETDRLIVGLLQRDGRASHAAIAQELGFAESTVRRRVTRLLDSKAIHVVAVPNPEAAGLALSAIITISCELARLEDVANTIAAFPEARYLGLTTGSADLVIEAFFGSHQHLLDFLTKRIASIPGITRTETNIVLKVAKFSYEWELPPSTEA